jgi:hypothetical protein
MPITLNTKVYNGVGYNPNGQFVYSETSGGVASSFSYLTAKVNVGTGKADTAVKWNLSVPVVATVDSECSCAGTVLRTDYVRIEVTVPAGATTAERLDLQKRVTELTASAQFKDSILALAQPNA